MVLASIPAVTVEATTVGINNVNRVDQPSFSGSGPGGDAYYNALTGALCGAEDPLREDGWGIIHISSLGSINTGESVWDEKTRNPDGVEFYGIYYGRIDDRIDTPGSLSTFSVRSQPVSFAIYMNPVGTFEAAGGLTQGASGRTGFDQYNGITGITGGTLILSGSVRDGEYSFTPDGDYANITSGNYVTRGFEFEDGEWCGLPSDSLLFQAGLSFNVSDGDWMTCGNGWVPAANVPGYDAPVDIIMTTWGMTTVYEHAPEPLTMSLLAVGALAVLRRRR